MRNNRIDTFNTPERRAAYEAEYGREVAARRFRAQVFAGRAWLLEEPRPGLDAEDIGVLTDEGVMWAVQRHFQGGWITFCEGGYA